MSLNLMEKRLLSLYRELYGREYDVNDTRTYENSKEYLKSNELQTTYLLFQRANVLYPNYHFMKGQHGVYSTRVQTTIDHLNQSEQDIQNFYQTYESVKNGDYFNYYCQLLSTLYPYFPDYQIYKITLTGYLFRDIVNQANGTEQLGKILLATQDIFYPEGLTELQDSFQQNHNPVDVSLQEATWNRSTIQEAIWNRSTIQEAIWDKLTILGVIPMEPDYHKSNTKPVQKTIGTISKKSVSQEN